MNPVEILRSLCGRWSGTYQLWHDPSRDPSVSQANAQVRSVAKNFVAIDYTWSHEERPENGVFLFGYEPEHRRIEATWADSWHMNRTFMQCRGEPSPDGKVIVVGEYAAPNGGEQWRWRTEVMCHGVDVFCLKAINISPTGREDTAVEALFRPYQP